MTARSTDLAPALGWGSVARSYRTLVRALIEARPDEVPTGHKVAM